MGQSFKDLESYLRSYLDLNYALILTLVHMRKVVTTVIAADVLIIKYDVE